VVMGGGNELGVQSLFIYMFPYCVPWAVRWISPSNARQFDDGTFDPVTEKPNARAPVHAGKLNPWRNVGECSRWH
jgi:hypothetical protein